MRESSLDRLKMTMLMLFNSRTWCVSKAVTLEPTFIVHLMRLAFLRLACHHYFLGAHVFVVVCVALGLRNQFFGVYCAKNPHSFFGGRYQLVVAVRWHDITCICPDYISIGEQRDPGCRFCFSFVAQLFSLSKTMCSVVTQPCCRSNTSILLSHNSFSIVGNAFLLWQNSFLHCWQCFSFVAQQFSLMVLVF